MSEPLDDEAEVIDGVPVLPEEPAVASASAAGAMSGPGGRSRALAVRMPAPVQAALAAVGGVLAGAAIVGLVRRRGRRSGALARRSPIRVMRRGAERGRRGGASELVQVVASRSLLVDVHLLGSRSGQDRRR